MNDQNEIGGDLADEYREIQEQEYRDANEGAPVVKLADTDVEAWYVDWIARQDVPANIDRQWPDCFVI